MINRLADDNGACPVEVAGKHGSCRDSVETVGHEPKIVAHVAVEGILHQVVAAHGIAVAWIVDGGTRDNAALQIEKPDKARFAAADALEELC